MLIEQIGKKSPIKSDDFRSQISCEGVVILNHSGVDGDYPTRFCGRRLVEPWRRIDLGFCRAFKVAEYQTSLSCRIWGNAPSLRSRQNIVPTSSRKDVGDRCGSLCLRLPCDSDIECLVTRQIGCGAGNGHILYTACRRRSTRSMLPVPSE